MHEGDGKTELDFFDLPLLRRIAPLVAIVFVDGLALSILYPILPFYAQKFGASPALIGVIISLAAFFQAICSPLFGKLSDRKGRKPMLILGQCGSLLGMLTMVSASGIWILLIGRVLCGLSGGSSVIALATVSDVTKPHERTEAFSKIVLAQAFTFVIGPAIVALLIKSGYQGPLYAAAGSSGLSIIISLIFLNPRKNTQEITSKEGKQNSFLDNMRELGGNRKTIVLLVSAAFFWLSFFSYYSIVLLFYQKKFTWNGVPFTSKEGSYLVTYVGIVSMAIQLFLPKLMRKYESERKLIIIGFSSSIIGYFFINEISEVAWFFAVAPLIAVGNGILRTSLMGAVSKSFKKENQGFGMGFYQTINSFAQVAAPPMSAFFFQYREGKDWPLLACCLSLLGLIIAFNNQKEDVSMSKIKNLRRFSPQVLMGGAILTLGAIALIFKLHSEKIEHIQKMSNTLEADLLAGPHVRVVEVSHSPAETNLELIGEVHPFATVTLYSKINGYLKDILVETGDRVSKNQVIASVDSPEIEKQYQKVLFDLKNKKLIARRMNILSRKHLVAQQIVDQANADANQVQFEAASIAEQIRYQKIRAPFSGTVVNRFADPGALLQNTAGSLPVATISKLDQLRILVYVDQKDANGIRPGIPAKITIRERPEIEIMASVTRLSGELEAKTKTLCLEIDIDNSQGQIISGSFVQVQIKLKSESRLQVPIEALITKGEKTSVAVVDGQNMVRFKPVHIGKDDGRMATIISGLLDGEQVALSLSGGTRDGQHVQPIKLESLIGKQVLATKAQEPDSKARQPGSLREVH